MDTRSHVSGKQNVGGAGLMRTGGPVSCWSLVLDRVLEYPLPPQLGCRVEGPGKFAAPQNVGSDGLYTQRAPLQRTYFFSSAYTISVFAFASPN